MESSNLAKLVLDKILPVLEQDSEKMTQVLQTIATGKEGIILNTLLGLMSKMGMNPFSLLSTFTDKIKSLTNAQWLAIEDIIYDILEGKDVTFADILAIIK